MTLRDWVQLAAALGHAALAALALARGGKSPLARPLAWLCLDLFGWNFATLAFHLSGAPVFSWLDAALTALSPPLVLHLVVAFVGARRAMRRVVRGAYAAFGAMALASALAIVSPALGAWVDSRAWAAMLLAGWLPCLVLLLALLVRHLQASGDDDEKARTRTVTAALLVGGALATIDLLDGAGLGLPHTGALGTLASTSLLATAVFRFRLFDRDLSISTAVYAGAIALVGLAGYLVVFAAAGSNLAAWAFGVAAVTGLLFAAARELFLARAERRTRTERFAALGRVAAQMAHDLKNPLAAILGAAQILEDEATPEERRELAGLIALQARRIHAIVDTYERVGRIEPQRSPVDLRALVDRAVAAQAGAASAAGVELRADHEAGLPSADADADLLASVVENLVKNALDATAPGGTVTVRARAESAEDDRPGALVVEVEDTGAGMDARHAELAFDDFFSTKGSSGLGLAFVRRVAHAHGGRVTLASTPKIGTRVALRLPL